MENLSTSFFLFKKKLSLPSSLLSFGRYRRGYTYVNNFARYFLKNSNLAKPRVQIRMDKDRFTGGILSLAYRKEEKIFFFIYNFLSFSALFFNCVRIVKET